MLIACYIGCCLNEHVFHKSSFKWYQSLGLVVGESFWVLLFLVCDLNVVNVTSFILASLNVNFVRKFAISNVEDVVHMSMNFELKFGAMFLGNSAKSKGWIFGFLFDLFKNVLR